ncbi:armadillo-type protein [Zychaea mexicana]|uniref:armadillo-type protein n=1 Tax=Zychaea mexicana TaxID=64656 RepID=UPI0022FEF65F|nr:armadillo-type protein [Zychaea mexicana]KAI9493462.1 armadillo-type protein [Zychaea mexicana]
MSDDSMKELEEQLNAFKSDLEKNQNDDEKVASVLLKRAVIYEKLNKFDQARADIQTVLQRNPSNEAAKKQAQELYTRTSTAAAITATETSQSTKENNEADPLTARFQQYLQRISSNNLTEIRSFIQTNDFVDVLFACGTPEASTQAKATAYMILTKLFNPPPEIQKDYPIQQIIELCARYFSRSVDSGKNAEKLLAYRTLLAVFETSMTIGAAILSQEGTVEEMMDTIDFEIPEVQQAMADILAIASSDKSCQKVIVKHGSEWLANTASRAKDEKLKATARTTLTKLQAQQQYGQQDENNDGGDKTTDFLQEAMSKVNLDSTDLTDTLMAAIKSYKTQDDSVVLNAVEGLAYSTLQGSVKEAVANDPVLLKALVAVAINTAGANSNPLLFGIGTIFKNITTYKPVLDEQQKQIKRLREMANAKSKGKPVQPEQEDATEDDSAVDDRVRAAVDNGAALALLVLSKNTSDNLKAVAAQTYLNLVTPQTTRGKLLQQGIIKGLLPLAQQKKDAACYLVSAQALAKLAITSDPRIAFGVQTSHELVAPFLALCKDSTQLRQFEGLMSLTNLASVDDQIRQRIYIDGGMSAFENLQLSNNDMVQRAATEMICNMTFCDPVFETYSTSSNRLRLLMVLSDHEDPATRRASSGALAILANSKEACDRIIKVDKAYERITRLLSGDEEVDIQHRGIEVVRCVVGNEGKEAAEGFAKEQAHVRLAEIVMKCQVNVVRTAAMEVLKMFVANGVQIK